MLYQTRQRDVDAPINHLLPRGTSPGTLTDAGLPLADNTVYTEANRLAPKGLTRRVSEPRVPKSSKLTKSLKEDKELEEMSAFFSQRPYGARGPPERDLGDPEKYSRGLPLDPEPRYSHGSPHRSYSARSSEPSFRHHAAESGELVPRPLSSLPTTKRQDSGRPRHTQNNGSAWSQEYDGRPIRAESESNYSRRARSRASGTSVARDTFEPQETSKPGAAAEPKRRFDPDNVQGVLRNTCRDAAAQTDPTPKRPRRHDDASTTRTRGPQNGRRDNTIVSPGAAATQDSPQLSTDRGVEVWPAARLSRHVTHAEPDVECWETGQDSRRSGPGCDFPVTRRAVGETGLGVDTAVGLGYHEEVVATLPPLNHLSLLDAQVDCASGHPDAAGEREWTGHPSNIMGNFGFENLEAFIQRIEGEAGISQGQLDQEWALPCGTSGLRNGREPGRSALSLDGTHDKEVYDDARMSSRDWFPSEAGLLGPGPAAGSPVFLGEAEGGWPMPRPVLEPYPSAEGEGYLTARWRGRDMF